MKKIIPTEDQECYLLAEWLRAKKVRFNHVANERWTTIQYKMKLKRLGVSSGFPDYIIFVPKGLIFIEMKRTKGGKVSDSQKEWIKYLNDKPGCVANVCLGFEEAKKLIEKYL